MVDFIAEVDKFIKKRNNGEFAVTPIASQLYYEFRKVPYKDPVLESMMKAIRGAETDRILLGDCLAISIKEYELNTNKPQKRRLAKKCYNWINTAWSIGAMQEGQGLGRQLDECREEKEATQKELETLSADYKRLENQLHAIRLRFNLESEEEGRERHK